MKPLAEVMAELFHLGEPAILAVGDLPPERLYELADAVQGYCAGYGLEPPLIVAGDVAQLDEETMRAGGWVRA